MRFARHALAAALAALGLLPSIALAAGPPFPDPVTDQAVYDTADAFDAATVAAVEAQIDKVEAETGAEIVVYTQLVDGGVGYVQAEQHAIALMDQWGVGRAGVDDGLVILYDLYQNDPCHGQVQLYAGPGFRDAWLSNGDRQRIFENDMLPRLRECDLDGSLTAAMDKISGIPRFRQVNAVLGLVVAPGIVILVVGWALARWYRSGRDPVYLDDPSIHYPAPPPGLTPASGAAMRDGSVTRRALTAASLDLAARGRIAFRAEEGGGFLGLGGGPPEIGISTFESQSRDPVELARLELVRRRPMDEGTAYLLGRFKGIAGADGYIDPDDILKLGTHVGTFNSNVERHLVQEGWYREAPGKTAGRWASRGVLLLVLAIVVIVIGANLPASGLVLIGVALGASAVFMWLVSGSMPARTRDGAVIVAMLAAYRRTLEKTMAQARSMGQVVDESAIPLIENPDDAVVWGNGARPPVGGRIGAGAVRRGSQGGHRDPHVLLPDLVLQRLVVVGQRRRWRRLGAGGHELVADPQLRRDDGGGARDDRNSPASSGSSGGGGFSGGSSRRRRRRGGRRLLGSPRATLGPMGATDTMEVFFERLNDGEVDVAVGMMDERVEMRVHVGDNARMLRGVEAVGGWFLRADKGIKMVPGDVRDLGNTWQVADLIVLRPGAPSQHLDAQFRVEAGKITSINLTPFSR